MELCDSTSTLRAPERRFTFDIRTMVIQVSNDEVLAAATLEGLRVVGILTLQHEPQVAKGTFGWLAVEFDARRMLVVSVRSVDVEQRGAVGEVFVPTLEVTERLPALPSWPEGPASSWAHVATLETDVVGYELERVRILSKPFDARRLDAGISLELSGPHSLLIQTDDALPMTLSVTRYSTGRLPWHGTHRAARSAAFRLA